MNISRVHTEDYILEDGQHEGSISEGIMAKGSHKAYGNRN